MVIRIAVLILIQVSMVKTKTETKPEKMEGMYEQTSAPSSQERAKLGGTTFDQGIIPKMK